jgi:hypothetical protein
MRYIFESDLSWFENEDVAIDIEGNELCPSCCCCLLVEAVVVSGSIFVQIKAIPIRPGTGAACLCRWMRKKISAIDKPFGKGAHEDETRVQVCAIVVRAVGSLT